MDVSIITHNIVSLHPTSNKLNKGITLAVAGKVYSSLDAKKNLHGIITNAPESNGVEVAILGCADAIPAAFVRTISKHLS